MLAGSRELKLRPNGGESGNCIQRDGPQARRPRKRHAAPRRFRGCWCECSHAGGKYPVGRWQRPHHSQCSVGRSEAARQEVNACGERKRQFLRRLYAAGEQIQLKGTTRRSFILDALPRHRHSGHWISSPANIFLTSGSDKDALEDLRGTPILW